LAREPGNSSALKVYRDVLPHCGRKEEVPFVQKQIADGAKLPMPEVQVHLEPLKTEEVEVETQEKSGEFFSAEEVAEIKLLVEAFKQNPHGTETGDALRNLRLGMAEYLLGSDLEALKALFSKDYGEIFSSIIESGLINSDRLPEEENVALAVRSYFAALGEKLPDVRFLLVGMLFFHKLHNLSWPHAKLVPEWIRSKYENFFNVDGFQFHQTADPAKEVLGKEKDLLCQSESDTLVSVQKMGETATNCDASTSRILFLTGSARQYMVPPEFGAFQINAGPDWENDKDALGRWKSLKTPVGRYAVDSLLRQLPPDEQPDILVCLVDASRRSMPTGLSAFRGPKVLLVADTHHMQSPLQWMMAYAASEPFDRIAFLYDRHHIPFFQAAGFKNLFWLPGFTFPHDDAALEKVSKLGRQNIVGFVGQAGKFHPRRVRLLEALQAGQIPFLQKAVSQSESLKFYAAAAVGFNASLNGDLNLRFFEVLSSGAAVLTDSLGLDSGLELLADAGCRFETYSSAEELVEKAKNLLGNPKHAAEIGKAGRSWFLEHLRDEKRCEIFQQVAFDGVEPELFKIPSPPLFKISFSGTRLQAAVEVYEFVQELHRVQERVTILRDEFASDIDFFKSLPRVEIEEACEERKSDLLVTSVAGDESARLADGKHLWVVDAENNEPVWLQSLGYSRLSAKAALFERKYRPFTGASATLEVAVSAFHAGRLAEAEDVCRDLLQADEKCAGAWNLMGRMAALNGDLETAGDFASVACELEPVKTEFIRDLGEVFLRRKEMEPAEVQARRALELEPETAENLVLLGRVLAEKGEQGNALGAFEKALRLKKDDAEAITHYAMALQKFDRGKDAISQIRKACVLEPDSVEHQTNFASLLEQNKRYVDALAAYGKAARMNPDVGYIWFRQGKLLNGLKRYAESIPMLEKAVSLPGRLGEFHYELGLALHMSKRFPEALDQYGQALAAGYNTAALQCNRGVIFKELRRGGDSIMAFHTAVKMDPSNLSYLNNLGAAALEIGLNSEALDCFEEAVRQNPKIATAQNNIGNLLKDRARGMDALPHYRKSMELDPSSSDTQSNYLLCHMYLSEMDPKTVFEEHRKWGLEKAKKTPPAFKFKPRSPGSKLRVGFLSGDLCHHPVAHFIEPLFREYDKERFEFVAYGDQRKSDEFSERFAKQVDLWRETCSLTDEALAKKIHEDRVDILFELSGHTAYNRMGVLALKPAPLQASYLGYPGTTGLPTMDFRITDELVDPLGMTEKFHTERLIRLSRCAWCYEPDAEAPEVGTLPFQRNGHITFGCFNNMAKLNPALFDMWAEILIKVPDSHLRLKARTLTDDRVKNELKDYFTAKGIAAERLDFFGHTRKIHEHLNHYHQVDIALDSFPYHGTTTTCEAMWMGCPVVTRAGAAHVSRVGVSLLSAVGLEEFIGQNREDYIGKAAALAGDIDRLVELRAGMRGRLKSSPLMNATDFAREFEVALLQMAEAR
jgi:predicted O-linked N-acetylglucosamine transferase (SPINDLY family)